METKPGVKTDSTLLLLSIFLYLLIFDSSNTILLPTVEAALASITQSFALKFATELASTSSNLTNLLANAPQTVTQPISYTVDNLRPFDIPV